MHRGNSMVLWKSNSTTRLEGSWARCVLSQRLPLYRGGQMSKMYIDVTVCRVSNTNIVGPACITPHGISLTASGSQLTRLKQSAVFSSLTDSRTDGLMVACVPATMANQS